MKRLFVLVAIVLLIGCSAPEAEVIRETVISEVPVTVEVTSISEVEVTRVVEVPVTVLFKVTAEPTNTPLPTATPKVTSTPEIKVGSSQSPIPVGEAGYLVQSGELDFTVTVLEAIRGADALSRIKAANQFNEDPPEGYEFVLLHVEVEYIGSDAGPLEIDKTLTAVVTKGNVINYFDTFIYAPCCLEPDFDLQLLAGGIGDGWFALPVALDDTNPLMLLGPVDGGVYFSLTP